MKYLLRFSALLLCVVFLPALSQAKSDITAMEYFINTDPGYGNGTSIAITSGPEIDQSISIATESLGAGFHTLFIRAQNSDGDWGLPEARPFYITDAPSAAEPSPITQMEYFFNDDPGTGSGTPVSITEGTDIDLLDALATASLDAGFHTLFVRAQNESGSWGLPEARPFFITDAPSTAEPSPITQMEYFFNDDPGTGSGTSVSITQGTNIDLQDALATASLDAGFHTLFVRAQNENGSWGLPEARPFYITDAPSTDEPSPITQMEYFFNDDPGTGSGTPLSITQGTEIDLQDALATASLDAGFHTLFVRAQNGGGSWGLTETRPFYITPEGIAGEPEPIASLEYFFGDDPGTGQGTAIQVSPGVEIDIETLLPTSAFDAGSYNLSVRALSESGTWGIPKTESFTISDAFRDITFSVDMSVYENDQKFDPESENVYLRADFNGFDLTLMEESSPGIYEAIAENVFGEEGDEIEYRFYYAPPGDAENGVWEENVGPGTDGNRLITLQESGAAITADTVFFNNQVPNPIAEILLQSPANDTASVNRMPEFSWQISEAADEYEFRLALDDEFTQIISDSTGITVEGSASIDNEETITISLADELEFSTQYYWKVRGLNQWQTGEWSETWNFTTIPEQPGIVKLFAPNDGSTDIAPDTSLVWFAGEEVNHYRLQLSESNTFENVVLDSTLADTSLAADGLIDFDSTYHWRVKAANDGGESDWSTVWSFSTLPAPPAQVALIAPEDGAPDIEINPTLTWEQSDDALSYRLQLSLTQSFEGDDLVADTSGVEGTELLVGDDLDSGTEYFWRVNASNSGGIGEWSDVWSFNTQMATSIEGEEIPAEFTLRQNYPNPFNPSTHIRYGIPEASPVRLEVYNIIGQRVAILVDEQKSAGWHTVNFDASALSSGIYLYRIQAGEFTETRKLTLMK